MTTSSSRAREISRRVSAGSSAAMPRSTGFAARREHLAPGGERVGVADLPGPQRPAQRHELAAGGQHGDPWAARDRQFLDADRGEQPELGGSERRPLRQHDIAGAHVFAGVAHVAAHGRRFAHVDPAVALLDVLDLHDRVGAVRQGRPGHDAGRLAHAQRHAGHAARGDLGDDGKARDPGGVQVGAAHGEAVHGGVVERGHRFGRDDVGGDGAPQRLEQRHALGRQRPHRGEHQVDGFAQGDHRAPPCVRVMVVELRLQSRERSTRASRPPAAARRRSRHTTAQAQATPSTSTAKSRGSHVR